MADLNSRPTGLQLQNAAGGLLERLLRQNGGEQQSPASQKKKLPEQESKQDIFTVSDTGENNFNPWNFPGAN